MRTNVRLILSEGIMSNLKIPQSIQLSVDDTEKIELAEIQTELNESRAQNDQLEAELILYRQRLNRCQNTGKAIENLDGDSTTWLTIGKMFVKFSRSDVESEVEKELKTYQKKVSDLEVLIQSPFCILEARSVKDPFFGVFRPLIVGYWIS